MAVLTLQVFTQQYVFPMKLNSPWLEEVNLGLGTLDREGAVSTLFSHYVPDNCPPTQTTEDVKSLTLNDLGGVFFLAAIATGLSLAAKFAYMFFVRRKKVSKLGPLLGKNAANGQVAGMESNGGSRVMLSKFSMTPHGSVATTKQISITIPSQDAGSRFTINDLLESDRQSLWPEKQL